MALIQAARPGGTGGGGGGLTITGFSNEQLVQTTNFVGGLLSIPLANVPLSDEAIIISYNGQTLLKGSAWSYNSGTNDIDILFTDSYVTTYDENPVFQINYPY